MTGEGTLALSATGKWTAQPFRKCNWTLLEHPLERMAGNDSPAEVVVVDSFCCNSATPVDLAPYML